MATGETEREACQHVRQRRRCGTYVHISGEDLMVKGLRLKVKVQVPSNPIIGCMLFVL